VGYRNNRRRRDLFKNQDLATNAKRIGGIAALVVFAWWMHSKSPAPVPGGTGKANAPGSQTTLSAAEAAKRAGHALTPAEKAREEQAAKDAALNGTTDTHSPHPFPPKSGGEPSFGTSGNPFQGQNPLGQSQPKAPSQTGGWLARWFPGFSSGASGSSGSASSTGSDTSSDGSSPGSNPGNDPPPGGVFGSPASGSGAGNTAGSGPSFGVKGTGQLGPGGSTGKGAPTFLDNAFGAQNAVVIQNFQNATHLFVPNIPSCQYLTLDLDAGLAGINIYNPLQGVNVSIAAKSGVVTQAQLQQFVGSGDTGLPALNGVSPPAALGTPTTVAATSGSGLQDSQTWEFVSNNHTVQIALMVRTDSQGTYLAIVNAPGTNVTSAIEYYAQYFQQLKVN
jgi:hypothetical protein